MVIVQLIGGLGNQLFQYAAGLGVALRNRAPLKMDLSAFDNYKLHAYSLNHLNISASVATQAEINNLKRASEGHILQFLTQLKLRKPGTVMVEAAFHFDPVVLLLRGSVYLQGYWQSEKYFDDVQADVRREYTVKTAPDAANAAMARKIASSESVCVHVRRKDYISNTTTHQIHGVCSIDYYRAAVERMTGLLQSPHFFVFSDDPQWTRNNMAFGYPTTYVEHNGADRNYEDLRLMSSGKHFIIANSTFGWWGAWLSVNPEKLVIAPTNWFNNAPFDTANLIPDAWIRI